MTFNVCAYLYKVIDHGSYMQKCFDLAQRSKGFTTPNPMVGTVLVHHDRIIGEGWHHFYGADHAEVNCLKNVTDADKRLIPESTMYVNLEPCAHYGLTPPCASRIVAEGIKKVVVANTDPFEKVNGSGIKILQDAGVSVETGLHEKEGLWLNRRFFCFHQQKRPYIVLKWAQTKDGFIAPEDRSRYPITGAGAQSLVHKWRTEETAIMVGTTTALNDNPELTARLHKGNHPLRIVLDRHLQIPRTHHIFDDTAATWIINEQQELLDGNIHFVQLPFNETLLPALMSLLYRNRILSLLIEGGAALLSSFISMDLWDEARVFTGDGLLQKGIRPPLLAGDAPAFTTMVGQDTLQVSVNKNSAYQYTQGMEL